MEINKEAIEQMHGTRLFEGLSIGHLTELYSIASMELRDAGEAVVNEGENGNCFYWVHSGRLEVQFHKIKDDPKPIVINTIKAGEVFGEMILLGKNRRTASVVVRNKCSLLSWKDKDCLDFFTKNPLVGYHVMMNLSKILGDRLLDMNLQIRNNSSLVESTLTKYF